MTWKVSLKVTVELSEFFRLREVPDGYADLFVDVILSPFDECWDSTLEWAKQAPVSVFLTLPLQISCHSQCTAYAADKTPLNKLRKNQTRESVYFFKFS
jgi:hypothetical protein